MLINIYKNNSTLFNYHNSYSKIPKGLARVPTVKTLSTRFSSLTGLFNQFHNNVIAEAFSLKDFINLSAISIKIVKLYFIRFKLNHSTVKSLNCMFVISSASKYFGIKYFETYSLEHILEHENRFIWRFWFSTNYLVLDSSELSKDLTYSRSDRVERILELCLHKVSNKNYLLNWTFLFLHILSQNCERPEHAELLKLKESVFWINSMKT